jgi:DNA-binding NarL/FixJ family response regulator
VTSRLVVLVVDDDPRVRAALVSMLDGTDGLYVVAVDADQALRLSGAATLRADVALADLPDDSEPSLRVVRRLSAAMPVVAVSMQGATRLPALRAGAAAFVEKDGDAAAILRAISTARAASREEPDR